MGASGKAVWLEDVDSGREMKCLQTGSDVFAVWQQPVGPFRPLTSKRWILIMMVTST